MGRSMTAPATRTPISWSPPEGMTFEQWEEALVGLLAVDWALPWMLGDCLNAGEAAFGQLYAQAIPADRYAVSTLANLKWVASRIEASRRRERVPFSHHQEIAPLEPKEQDRWLERSETEGMTRKALRAALRPLVAGPAGEGDGEATEPEAEILPPKAKPTTEYHDADEDQLESLKRAWNRAGQETRESFLDWTKDNERPVFDAGQADPKMPKFLRRGARA